MDDWRIHQQQQQRMSMNNIGPIHSYHSIRSRPAPYQYPPQSAPISVKTDSNLNMYTPVPYTPTYIDQRMNVTKPNYHLSPQQSLSSSRTRSMPYPSPSLYPCSSGSVCQCTSHMPYPPQHQMYHQSYPLKNKISTKSDESYTSTSYHPSICSNNSFIPAQQLTPITQDYQTYSNQSQIFPSPPSNPSTPYQNEFNGNNNNNTEFGVPYNHGQPSSVNSLTDALCPNGETHDRQMTPGPPSVGTPRVAQHQYSFPQTPLTPSTTTTSSRLANEQNIDELTAFLQDPMNIYLTDDITSTLFDDIEALAETYLGGGYRNESQQQPQQQQQQSDIDYNIILNYLCSDDLLTTVCTN